jgi:putative phosphonate metabolism protein
MSAPRYAIYYTPNHDHPLVVRAAAWLGRDAFSGANPARPDFPSLADLDLDEITQAPRLYGFHGTLKAPFALAAETSESALLAAAQAFARDQRPFSAAIAPASLGAFIAFRPTSDAADVQRLHEDCVRAFEPFRALLSEADIARRRKAPLTPEQDAFMLQWGYPYVFNHFRFHMTLTGSVTHADTRARILSALQDHFSETTGPHSFDSVCVFKQPDRSAPFRALQRFPFQSR